MFNRFNNAEGLGLASLMLRVGLGLVFVIGGINKLSQLLDPQREAAILNSYWGSKGYVNQFIVDFMFGSDGISSWWFLTSLSFFEAISGFLLIFGLLVRPLSLIYGFLLWSFIIALPVVTTPQVDPSVQTYMAPALLVQIRDVALSGMMFVLYNLGAGIYSLDRRFFTARTPAPWDNLGLLLRLSVALPLLVAGVFNGMPNISSFASSSLILIPLALWIASGNGLRYAGPVLAAVMLWYMAHKLNADKSLIGNLNGFKREFAFLAGGLVLALFGGGGLYTLENALHKIKGMFSGRDISTQQETSA